MFTFKYLDPPRMFVFNSPQLISNKGKNLLIYGKTFVLYNQEDESITYPQFTTFGSDLISVESIYLAFPVLQNDHRHKRMKCAKAQMGDCVNNVL